MRPNELSPASGATHSKKRVGRGNSSGHGSTSSRGNKGAGQRAGFKTEPRFEGGQTPLYRRLPKVGFTNIFRKTYSAVNLDRLKDFPEGVLIDAAALENAGVIKSAKSEVKILGTGDLSSKLNFKVHACSASALQKIQAKGGVVEIIAKPINKKAKQKKPKKNISEKKIAAKPEAIVEAPEQKAAPEKKAPEQKTTLKKTKKK